MDVYVMDIRDLDLNTNLLTNDMLVIDLFFVCLDKCGNTFTKNKMLVISGCEWIIIQICIKYNGRI